MTDILPSNQVPEPALPNVTVAILTWNGERYLADILTALDDQRYGGDFDVLVIDSGSTDRTLQIVAEHPTVRLHEIPNKEFGHGRTRNLAAELSSGEIIVYLTHDAVPLGADWLQHMVEPFVADLLVVAVLGRQVARANAPPLLKYDIERVFARQGQPGKVTVFRGGGNTSDQELRVATFYSDACSAARRETLLNRIPYQDVDYAEDQRFGRDVIMAGLSKAYAAKAVVEHSNDGTLREFGARITADLVGLRKLGIEVVPVTRVAASAQWLKWSVLDTGRILIDADFRFLSKLYWLVMNPVYHAVKWSHYRRASRAELN